MFERARFPALIDRYPTVDTAGDGLAPLGPSTAGEIRRLASENHTDHAGRFVRRS